MKKKKLLENIIHGIFLILGLITVGCVLMITVYLIISGIPAIKEIGLTEFLFGKEWASSADDPKYGILPFILTSIYGTAGAILIGVPIAEYYLGAALNQTQPASRHNRYLAGYPKHTLHHFGNTFDCASDRCRSCYLS